MVEILKAPKYNRFQVIAAHPTPSLIVPADAIIFNRDGLGVAVVEDGTARIRPVNVVRDFGTTVEVNRGIKGRRPGDSHHSGRSCRRPQGQNTPDIVWAGVVGRSAECPWAYICLGNQEPPPTTPNYESSEATSCRSHVST